MSKKKNRDKEPETPSERIRKRLNERKPKVFIISMPEIFEKTFDILQYLSELFKRRSWHTEQSIGFSETGKQCYELRVFENAPKEWFTKEYRKYAKMKINVRHTKIKDGTRIFCMRIRDEGVDVMSGIWYHDKMSQAVYREKLQSVSEVLSALPHILNNIDIKLKEKSA